MIRLRRGFALLGLVAAASLGSCDGGPPTPGTVSVSLDTPHTDDGAVAVTISGPGVTALAGASSGYLVYWRVVSETETRVLVFGNLSDGPLFSLTVANRNDLSVFTAVVTDAAARDDDQRTDLSAYSVTVRAVE